MVVSLDGKTLSKKEIKQGALKAPIIGGGHVQVWIVLSLLNVRAVRFFAVQIAARTRAQLQVSAHVHS